MIFINPHIKYNEVIIRFFFKEKDKMYKVYMGIILKEFMQREEDTIIK